MQKTFKIILPAAGWATRMRPQTWSKPKPLVSVAGRAVLDHLLESFASLPGVENSELVIITSPGLGETQIPVYMQEHYPQRKVHYVVQDEMKGQSHALLLAREHLSGPLLICFVDTLIETDFSFLAKEEAGGIAWVKQVPDPRRFGVAEVDDQGWVRRLVEKPTSMENNRVVVGCYYFQKGERLLAALEEQLKRQETIKGEYFLTEGINILLEGGLMMRTETVQSWLDTGTIAAALETNRLLLTRAGNELPPHLTEEKCTALGLKINPPVFIHETAVINGSVIGPHASIGAGCQITKARVEDSILEAEAVVDSAALQGSFLGRRARVVGRSAAEPAFKLNIGDDSTIVFE